MTYTPITITDLRKIYLSSKEDAALQPFVDAANLIVSEQLTGGSCTQSDARLQLIAEYLAAHFATITSWGDAGDPGALKSSKLGDSTDVYATPNIDAGGYLTTSYGQTAIALDTCGILRSSTTTTLKAQFRVEGTPPVGWPPGYKDGTPWST